jgi:outer membrane lipoprotein-sorting protein
MARHFLAVLLLLTLTLSGAQARAESVGADTLRRVEAYLQNLKTAQARFVQTTHNGDQLVGTFYLKRPGKLRFEYDEPVKDFVVADGTFIYFYDGKLKEQTNAPIGTTLADFFLRKELRLSGDLKVKESKRAGGLLQVQVVQAEEPQAGSITFGFTENPLELKKWRVIDGQGLITEVELFYVKTGVDLDNDLFIYVDPDKKAPKTSHRVND